LDAIVQDRKAAVDKILAEIPSAMSEAKGTEDGSFTKWVKSRLEDGTLGDVETVQQLLKIAKAATPVKVEPTEIKRRKERGADYANGNRVLTAFLNNSCNRLLREKRSARFIKELYELQKMACGREWEITCDDPRCATLKDSLDVAISAFCGHTICRVCYNQRRENEDLICPDAGCSSSMQDHHLFWPSKLGDLSKCIATPYGAKMRAAVDLLRKIETKKEQAILFVQFPNQLEEVEKALEYYEINATTVKVVEKASQQLKDFSEDAGTEKQKTVIVLDSSSETAAGSNLQNANYVIFFSPLLKITQYEYDSTMAQAIGRVRRHGQTKEIHVYRIVAVSTVDVDFLARFERRSDALVEPGAAKFTRPAHATSARERTQLVEENGRFSIRPHSWLIDPNADPTNTERDGQRVMGKNRVLGWEDFTSIVKFSSGFAENDE
jgi:hypothetical protein